MEVRRRPDKSTTSRCTVADKNMFYFQKNLGCAHTQSCKRVSNEQCLHTATSPWRPSAKSTQAAATAALLEQPLKPTYEAPEIAATWRNSSATC